MTKNTNPVSKALEALTKLDSKESLKQPFQVYKPIKREVKPNTFKLTRKVFWHLWKKHSDGKYIIDQRNEKVVYTVFKYFLGDPNFNADGLIKSSPSLEKGLLIYGDYGIGKSLLFEIMHKIGRELITNHNFKSLWFNCVSAGSFIDEYMNAATSKDSNFTIEHFYKGRLYIDDLGFEKKAFNKTEVFAELLFERNRNDVKTYVTTNLNPSTIQERYGERIGDRLPEMFNIIKWEGESFRE